MPTGKIDSCSAIFVFEFKFYKIMNKTFFLALSTIVFLLGCDSLKNEKNQSFTINAIISGVEDSTPVMLNLVREGDLQAIDTAYLENSRVSFKGTLESPEMIYLHVGNTRKLINLFGENSEISIKVNIDSIDQAKITGSSAHDDLMAFKTYLNPISEESMSLRNELQLARANGDIEGQNLILARINELPEKQMGLIKEFVKLKPLSKISPYIIRNYLAYEMDYPELNSLLGILDSSVHGSKDYQILSERLMTLKNVSVGMPAIDFALNDTTGTPIAISSFKGKYLLIDFWASWCGPCRIENPNIVALYNDFNDKGFEIIGVSFDEDGNKWVDAIKQDGLTWSHVSDLQGWGSAAGKLYGINSIPATVLLDRNGVIVAKNLRGDQLRKKLEELYAAEGQNS